MNVPRGTARAMRRASAASSIPLATFGGRTTERIMAQYGCDAETASRYCDLREEGYSQHQASLMAGLSDPLEDKP